MIRTIATAALFLLLASLSAADLSGQYAWSQVRTDGGGWVTGLVIHPTKAGLMYVRTDVGGAYRWNPATSRWSQILADGRGLPAGVGSGVESIALSKQAPDQVFLATTGGVFRSADRGASWSLGAGTAALTMKPNGHYRWYGERLAVDPQNAQVVYFGSRQDGLWLSLDGGASYARLSAVPAGATERNSGGAEVNGTAIGISWVVVDAGGGMTSGRSSRIYAGVAGQGIWRSLDGGSTWASISGASGPATGVIPSDAEVGPDGRLWVSAISNYTQIGGVWTKAQGSLWSFDRATSTWAVQRPSGSDQSWAEVAVDPTNASRIIVADQAFTTYVTVNGGTAWSYRAPNTSTWQAPEARWVGVTTAANQLWRSWSSPGALSFDPLSPGRLWYAEGFGVWSTSDSSANPVVWTNRAAGIEEVVAFGAVHPPGGKLVTAAADLGGFYHDQGTATPPMSRILTQKFTTTTSLVYGSSNPAFLAAVSANHHQNWLDYSGTSSDGGQTWQRFASLVNGTHPESLKFGTIAVAANSTQNLVWAPWNWGALHYSTDGGGTWRPGVISGTTAQLNDLHYGTSWATSAAVVADGAQAGTFYCYQRSYGDFYRSTDGGATWTLRSRNQGTLDWMEGEGGLVSVPGQAGHLWFAAAPHSQSYSWFERGLWRSTDGGTSWTKLSTVTDARMMTLGPAKPGTTYPTLFAHAQVGGVEGVWRSTDQGATWDRLTVYANPLGLLDSIRSITCDWNTFGRVYIGFGGNGFAVGQPAAAAAAYAVAYQVNSATSGSVPVDSAAYAQGATVTTKANSGGLARTGYSFAGWNTATNGSGTSYAAGTGTFVMGSANVTLYARWTQNTYLVTYNGNGQSSGTAPVSQTKTYGVALTLQSNSGNLVRTGYTFAGWNTAANGTGTDYAVGASYTANAAVVLQAKWSAIANTAPSVSAGPDRTVTLPETASLDGTVTDDGLPSGGSLTSTWSKVSGPGTVTFGSATAVDTTAAFSTAGTYVLRLHASDSLLSASGDMQVVVNAAPTIPAGWSSQDLGTATPAGSALGDGDAWTIRGGGPDIWNSADGGRFAWQSLTGDCDLVVRVVSQTNTNAWAKAGLMIRESSAAGSRHVSLFVTPGNGVALQYRTNTNGSSAHLAGPKVAAPTWLKLTRRGNVFTGWQSANGTTWTLVGSRAVAIPASALVGLVVSSHSTTTVSTAVFAGFTAQPVAIN